MVYISHSYLRLVFEIFDIVHQRKGSNPMKTSNYTIAQLISQSKLVKR